jgi:LAO/AO transport system kinase
MKQVYRLSRKGLVIGITALGAGKSSLVDKRCITAGERVGIIAVDPSSPFSGGAILGDRIRMRDWGLIGCFHSLDGYRNLADLPVYSRRGSILDGYSRIIVETVGVGQDEAEIVKAADVSVVV